MPRDYAKKVLQKPHASREEICRAIMCLSTDLKYLINSMVKNPAQETQLDVRESHELLERLQTKLASLE
jgi:predicted translin family RNA/ssDNA-binding protein